jgi:hypothetical protein
MVAEGSFDSHPVDLPAAIQCMGTHAHEMTASNLQDYLVIIHQINKQFQ